MHRLIFFLYRALRFGFLVAILGMAQVANGQSTWGCSVSDTLKNAYALDANELAVQWLYSSRLPDTAAIQIPQRRVDTVLACLAAVWNTTATVEADSVFRAYCVHGSRYETMAPVHVFVDTAYAWTKQWALGNTATGVPALDALLTRAGVALTGYYTGASAPALNNRATLTPAAPVNMRAFLDSLKMVAGVKSGALVTDAVGSAGEAISIRRDTAFHLFFYRGWMDCPAGCVFDKTWWFTVSPATCSATLDSARLYNLSSTPPPYRNCLQPVGIPAPLAPGDFRLYPNPTGAVLRWEGAFEAVRLQVVDLLGRTWLTAACNGERAVGVERLPPGAYGALWTDRFGNRLQRIFYKQ